MTNKNNYHEFKEIREAFDDLVRLSNDSSIREIYNQRVMETNTINSAIREGYEDGKEVGLKEGEKKRAQEAALNALNLGLSIDMVSKISGLTEEEVRRLIG